MLSFERADEKVHYISDYGQLKTVHCISEWREYNLSLLITRLVVEIACNINERDRNTFPLLSSVVAILMENP